VSPTEERRHAADADAKLFAADVEIGTWLETPGRPTRADLVALRRLIHAIRVHFTVVRDS
jgi:hypothetical protein